MDKENKELFISTVMNDMTKFILNKVQYMPETWDGIELRQYISDLVAEQVNWVNMDKKRMKEYKNTRMIRGNL
jgi:hypothetical protein